MECTSIFNSKAITFALLVLILFTGCTVNEEKLKEIKSVAITNITIDREQEIKSDDLLSYILEPSKIMNILSNPSKLMKPISTEEIETYIIISNLINDFFYTKFNIYQFDQAKLARDDYYNSFSQELPKQLGKEYYVIPPYKFIDLSNANAKEKAKQICAYLNTDAIASLVLSYKMNSDVVNGQKTTYKYATLSAKIVIINKLGETVIDNTYNMDNAPTIQTGRDINTSIQDISKIIQSPSEGFANFADKTNQEANKVKLQAYLLATQAFLSKLNYQFKNKPLETTSL